MRAAGWILGLSLAAGAVVAQQPDTAAPIDFSVLTPAMEGRFVVAGGIDPTAFVLPMAIGNLGDRKRSDQLRALVAREGYQPARTIADRLIETLGAASYRATYEPIPRKRAGSIQSLAWSDLPEQPQGELMIDLTIRWICLCSDVAFTTFYPAISMNWRLLSPKQEIVQPTRTISYYHYPESRRVGKPPTSMEDHKVPEPVYPVEEVSEACGFESIKDAEENPTILWGCLGEAYDAALMRLVIDLKKLHPPRKPD